MWVSIEDDQVTGGISDLPPAERARPTILYAEGDLEHPRGVVRAIRRYLRRHRRLNVCRISLLGSRLAAPEADSVLAEFLKIGKEVVRRRR